MDTYAIHRAQFIVHRWVRVHETCTREYGAYLPAYIATHIIYIGVRRVSKPWRYYTHDYILVHPDTHVLHLFTPGAWCWVTLIASP